MIGYSCEGRWTSASHFPGGLSANRLTRYLNSEGFRSMANTPRTTRRLFLQGIGAIGAASILLPSTRRAFGFQSTSERPIFATIGLRNQGWAITSKSFDFADF